ncbi:hypothetical protein [uncultured Massilia sp.]|uniref:hypothetical protein n=1 Tax=uncultured Massilia sp. TaxID=169973 RepID=UPI0025DE0C24|nr:hypothetical protein [uncultured Massilia sp.]
MRPTDENQAGSKRPNLMSSSRRANGEINILAMLDGRSGRPLSRRGRALPAALWYASALLVACALVGTLAWLAHDGAAARYPGDDAAHAGGPHTGGPHAGDPHAAAGATDGATDGAVDARTGRPAAAPATAAAGAPADTSLEASLAAATQALAADAARIDAAAGHGNTEDATDDRPAAGHNRPAAMAMPSAMHATTPPTAPPTAPPTVPAAPAPVPGLVPASPPPPQHAGRATVIDLAPPQDRLAATPGLPPVPPMPPVPSGSSMPRQVSAASAAAPGRDGFHPPPPGMPGAAGPGALVGGARGAMGRTPATHRPAQPPMARSGVPARPRRPVATATPAPAVDGDVALITAIIQHTNRAGGQDSQEAGGAACAERSCGPRMPDRP